MRVVAVVLLPLLVACGVGPSSQPSTVASEPVEPMARRALPEAAHAPGREPSPAAGCETNASQATVQLRVAERATTPDGLEITIVRRAQDHFEDGTFDVWVELRFERDGQAETRIVSLLRPMAAEPLFDRICWRLAEASEHIISLHLFPYVP